ncbi:MAG TPA: 1-deoxy-D-xylulose-5-phosphate synthase N-terminal domain-containing protein, partial [Deltaproteobacteria bacterium]|nr:1-deoxy-D-xylulose-5-phosphate synthase N-terminal domain-containing protein [Deltaproteobacteria bacterium]
MSLLESINTPTELKALSAKQLPVVAEELRRLIIDTCASNGGHLAPSLGVVELTIALHRVFDSPADKIVWDVGHQAYAHKILTGRRDSFASLRKLNGISGFPKRCESCHDSFDVGHTSTSVSAATGFAAARDLDHRSNKVIAVIGDGSMTGGLAYEAINHAGHMHKDMIVILNDNEMSIAENVGALSNFLSRTATSEFVQRLKKNMESFLGRMDNVGQH